MLVFEKEYSQFEIFTMQKWGHPTVYIFHQISPNRGHWLAILLLLTIVRLCWHNFSQSAYIMIFFVSGTVVCQINVYACSFPAEFVSYLFSMLKHLFRTLENLLRTYWLILIITANSFRGNCSFLNLVLCTVTFGYST